MRLTPKQKKILDSLKKEKYENGEYAWAVCHKSEWRTVKALFQKGLIRLESSVELISETLQVYDTFYAQAF